MLHTYLLRSTYKQTHLLISCVSTRPRRAFGVSIVFGSSNVWWLKAVYLWPKHALSPAAVVGCTNHLAAKSVLSPPSHLPTQVRANTLPRCLPSLFSCAPYTSDTELRGCIYIYIAGASCITATPVPHVLLFACSNHLQMKAQYLPNHVFIGIFTYFGAAFTAVSGIQDKNSANSCGYDITLTEPDTNPASHYWNLYAGCRLSNGLGELFPPRVRTHTRTPRNDACVRCLCSLGGRFSHPPHQRFCANLFHRRSSRCILTAAQS